MSLLWNKRLEKFLDKSLVYDDERLALNRRQNVLSLSPSLVLLLL